MYGTHLKFFEVIAFMCRLEARPKGSLNARCAGRAKAVKDFFSVWFANRTVSICFDESDTFNHALFSIKQ